MPVDTYHTEINIVVLDHVHAFITIPGELSSLYDQRLKDFGKSVGFSHVSILGLTNDAHGYMILSEAWRRKTKESELSFGGENYGEEVVSKAQSLLTNNAP